ARGAAGVRIRHALRARRVLYARRVDERAIVEADQTVAVAAELDVAVAAVVALGVARRRRAIVAARGRAHVARGVAGRAVGAGRRACDADGRHRAGALQGRFAVRRRPAAVLFTVDVLRAVGPELGDGVAGSPRRGTRRYVGCCDDRADVPAPALVVL